jgi:hypothetical protein
MEDVGSDYATLEVRPDASWEEIQRAYHDLVRVWHPDRFASDRRLRNPSGNCGRARYRRLAGISGISRYAAEWPAPNSRLHIGSYRIPHRKDRRFGGNSRSE